jgi:hypothetical protein
VSMPAAAAATKAVVAAASRLKAQGCAAPCQWEKHAARCAGPVGPLCSETAFSGCGNRHKQACCCNTSSTDQQGRVIPSFVCWGCRWHGPAACAPPRSCHSLPLFT